MSDVSRCHNTPDRAAHLRCKRTNARFVCLIAAAAFCVSASSPMRVAAESPQAAKVQEEMATDVVLRAMVDEIDRGLAGLQLEDLKRPYFIEYGAQDAAVASVTASLGSVIDRENDRVRYLRVETRVGSYELDNTNFVGGGYSGLARAQLPIEDDYEAIRQAIWWATDSSYKSAAEAFPRKQALMESKVIEDKPADFTREQPVVEFEAISDHKIPSAALEKLAVDLSAIFRDYPDIQRSVVRIRTGAGNDYLVNTEGTRLRTKGELCELTVVALTQADDGMTLSDSMSVYLTEPLKVPTTQELAPKVRELADRLLKIRSAPKLESAYSGPVLVDAPAATAIFGGMFANRFDGGQRPVGSQSSPDDFEKKIGKRILPRSVMVIDDPSLKEYNGELLIGDYRYDDQGVAGQKQTLVDKGRLQELVMSRNPSKEFKQSTGHGRGSIRPSAMISNLIMTSSDPLTKEAMLEEFIEAFQDEDNEFGIRIASFGGRTPLEVYKVFADGREELVRGVNAIRADLRAFKRILAVGDTPAVMNVLGGEGGQSVVAPALLFEELDLAPMDSDFDKPPFIPGPLARQKEKQESGA
ncbi:MAG TPA: metallopeptidase TldD-related protein [Phycisphaerae bacterium]|nr:metallopeptidase TldD-related protein [Phycisphaerae bacterium]